MHPGTASTRKASQKRHNAFGVLRASHARAKPRFVWDARLLRANAPQPFEWAKASHDPMLCNVPKLPQAQRTAPLAQAPNLVAGARIFGPLLGLFLHLRISTPHFTALPKIQASALECGPNTIGARPARVRHLRAHFRRDLRSSSVLNTAQCPSDLAKQHSLVGR